MKLFWTILVLMFATNVFALTDEENQTVDKLKSIGVISNDRTEMEYYISPRTIDMFSADMKSFSLLDAKINSEVDRLTSGFMTEKDMLTEDLKVMEIKNNQLKDSMKKMLDDRTDNMLFMLLGAVVLVIII